MKRSIHDEIKKLELINILTFGLLILILVSILLWLKTIERNKDKIQILAKTVSFTLKENSELISSTGIDSQETRDLLKSVLNRLLKCFPQEFTAGFYSYQHDQILIAVSNNIDSVKLEGISIPSNDPSSSVLKILKPKFTWYWSKVLKTWLLLYDDPVIINGKHIGHSSANVTLNGIIYLYLSVGFGLLLIIFLGIQIAFTVSKLTYRRLLANINRLEIINDRDDYPIFDYEEFDRIATLNQKAFTDLRDAEKTIIDSYNQISNILESISDGFLAIDQNWRFTYVNKEAERILLRDRISLTGKVIWDEFPELQKIFYEQCKQVLSEKNTIHYESIFPNLERWFEIHIYLSDDNLAIYFREITQRKKNEMAHMQMEKELEAEKERLAITLRSTSDGVIATDQFGRITLINKAAEKMTGYSFSEAIGQPLNKVFYVINDRTSEPFEILSMLNAFGKSISIHHGILVNNALNELTISLSYSPIRSSQSEFMGAVIVFQDTTEKRRTEQELLKTEKLESLGILAGGIAHDFNNFLTSVLANVQLSKIKANLGEPIDKYLDETIGVTRKASELTKQLLTFSRGGAPVKKTVSINNLIKNVVDFSLRGSMVKPEFILPEDTWAVDIDESQISQVIQNLTINAKQAMAKGGIIKVASENIMVESGERYLPGKYVKLTIKDSGVGIPKENLNKIFDPFFTTKKEGTGLGLSTSYSIINKHYGYIEVDSKERIGTTFQILLPATQQNLYVSNQIHQVESSNIEGKILIMDDEEMIRKVVGEMLTYFGYQVQQAKDGQEAIELFKKALETDEPFDIIIMDLTIPGGLGGQETIAHLRNIDPNIKAIVSSGYANDPIIADYENYGFSGMVAKPYRFDELNKVLTKLLNKKQLSLTEFAT